MESYSLIHRVSVWIDEKVLEKDGGDDFTHNMNVFNATEGGKFYDMFIFTTIEKQLLAEVYLNDHKLL